MPKKVKLVLKTKTYTIVLDALDEGVNWGINRWLKYSTITLNPHERETLTDKLVTELTNALDAVVDLDA